MGSRYVVSGVQLGMLKAMAEHGDSDGIEKLTNEISENQWYKNSKNELSDDIESLRSNFFELGT
jgi:hypothetical protein